MSDIPGNGGAPPANGGAGSNGSGGDVGAPQSAGTGTPVPQQQVPPAVAPTQQAPDWTRFLASLETLNENLGGKLDTVVSEVRAASEPPPGPPADLEAMTRAELTAHIVGTVTQAIEARLAEVLNPLAQQVQQVQTATTSAEVNRSIEQLRAQHKDFNDWKEEMVSLAKTHPTLDIPSLYTLARNSNALKARELDARYNPPPPPAPPRWGGLVPAARGNGSTPPLTAQQAGVEAYREVVSRHPGVLRALEDL